MSCLCRCQLVYLSAGLPTSFLSDKLCECNMVGSLSFHSLRYIFLTVVQGLAYVECTFKMSLNIDFVPI